jgi:hypothetical protein
VKSKSRKKKILELRHRIEELGAAMTSPATYEEWRAENAGEIAEQEYLEEDLHVLETVGLQAQARFYGIDLFPTEGRIGDPELWVTTFNGRRFLTEHGLEGAQRLITEARFNYWKRWIDIVAPVASTIISIIALIVAIVALKK